MSLSVLTRAYCTFAFEGAALMLRRVNATPAPWVNEGQLARDTELRVGDRVSLPGAGVLEVERADPRPEWVRAHPELSAAIEQMPEDEGRWVVLGDRLLEAGSALGPRVALGRGAARAEDARALAPLNCEHLDGNLEVEWRYGFARRATLRAVDHRTYRWPWEWSLQRLLIHPLFHYLEELDLDASSLGPDAATEGGLALSLEQVAAEGPLPLLRRVRFGPVVGPVSWPFQGVWARCSAVHRRLSVEQSPVWLAGAARLELISGKGRPSGPLDFDGRQAIAEGVEVGRELGQWWVTDVAAQRFIQQMQAAPMKVNGRTCARHRLRPGDVLEPRPGMVLRFEMSAP